VIPFALERRTLPAYGIRRVLRVYPTLWAARTDEEPGVPVVEHHMRFESGPAISTTPVVVIRLAA
jgi:hypothetical protein